MKTADSPNNLKPLYTADERVEMKMIPLEADALAGKRVLLDPGHGVVYNDPNRRCQEWYVVHRIAWKLAEKLKTCKATVLWTRTAGFGLIAPNQINDEHAPENGEALYKIDIQDPARRQVTVQAANHHPDNLARLSDVLLTNHDNQDAELVVAVAERASLLSDNAAAVQQVAERIVAGLHLHWGIEPNSMVWDAGAQQFNFGVRRLANGHNAGTGSIQWNDATQSYEIAFVPNHPTPLEPQQVHAQPLRIADGDWFAVTEAMLTRLEDRSVRWSYQSEIGGTEVPQFKNQAQTAMGNAAKDYMRQACRWSDFGPADQPWAPGDPMLGMQTKYLHPNQAILPHYGWGIQDRKTYLQNTVCALYLTIHANAMPPAERRTIGSAMLYNSASAPVNQKRLAKIFLKYVDPFDQGTSNGGYYDSGVGLLTANGQHKENYAYTELDFMTSYSPADLVTRNGVRNGAGIQYEEMVGEDFVSNTATQLFNAAVEALLGPQDQGPLDQIYYQYVDKW
jgi:N-acetylmuramoyl-L-alanine amidase